MKKLLIAAASLVTAAAPMAASAAPFNPGFHPVAAANHWGGGGWNNGGWRGGGWGGYRPGWGYGYRGWGYGYPVAAGLFGLAVGTAIANQPYYYGGPYGPCRWVNREVVGPFGGVHYQTVRVCY